MNFQIEADASGAFVRVAYTAGRPVGLWLHFRRRRLQHIELMRVSAAVARLGAAVGRRGALHRLRKLRRESRFDNLA